MDDVREYYQECMNVFAMKRVAILVTITGK